MSPVEVLAEKIKELEAKLGRAYERIGIQSQLMTRMVETKGAAPPELMEEIRAVFTQPVK